MINIFHLATAYWYIEFPQKVSEYSVFSSAQPYIRGVPRMSNPRMSNPKMSNPKMSNPIMSNPSLKMSNNYFNIVNDF